MFEDADYEPRGANAEGAAHPSEKLSLLDFVTTKVGSLAIAPDPDTSAQTMIQKANDR